MKFDVAFFETASPEEKFTDYTCDTWKLCLTPYTAIIIRFTAWRAAYDMFNMVVEIMLPSLQEEVIEQFCHDIYCIAVEMFRIEGVSDICVLPAPQDLSRIYMQAKRPEKSANRFYAFIDDVIEYFKNFGTQDPK